MSEEQLSALLTKLKDDAALREKLQGAGDLDVAVALAKEAGFEVSKVDWLSYQDQLTLEFSDEELEGVDGGSTTNGAVNQVITVINELHCIMLWKPTLAVNP